VPVVEVNGARLWYDEAGQGAAVLLLHGGLGDSELWEPELPALSARFRTLRTDLRFYGRSAGPAAPFSPQADVVGVLDELGIERAALVGLSYGGRIAIDVALESPDRIWALAAVAPGLSGYDTTAYSEAQEDAYDDALAAGDLEAAMEVDFAVWAPLGTDDRIRRLWHATPESNPLPPGVEPRRPARPAAEHLDELAVPTLVVTARHDPPGFREIGPLVAREAPNARHVEVDSDHYLTLREPALVSELLVDFLAAASR